MPTLITETKILSIPPHALTSNGGAQGDLTVSGASDFKVGQTVHLTSNTQPTTIFGVKRVVGNTISLGLSTRNLNDRTDLSAFTTADSASLSAPEQDRSRESADEVLKYVYEREPSVALRTHLVDRGGEPLGTVANPVNVAGGGGGGGPTSLTYESLLPLLVNANWLNLSNFESVSVSTVGTVNTLSYVQGGCVVATGVFDYTDPTTWSIALNAFINDDDCTVLLGDDDTPLLLD